MCRSKVVSIRAILLILCLFTYSGAAFAQTPVPSSSPAPTKDSGDCKKRDQAIRQSNTAMKRLAKAQAGLDKAKDRYLTAAGRVSELQAKVDAAGAVCKAAPVGAGGLATAPGDCNGDGKLDITDGILIQQVSARVTSSVPNAANCDCNGDGNVVPGDAVQLLNNLYKGGPACLAE